MGADEGANLGRRGIVVVGQALEEALREPPEVVGEAVEVGVAGAFGHAPERMSGRERAHPIQADGEERMTTAPRDAGDARHGRLRA